MDKFAARYASQPTMPQNNSSFPMSGGFGAFGQANRFASLLKPALPMQNNPAAQIQPQAGGLANEQGIQQALAKVAMSTTVSKDALHGRDKNAALTNCLLALEGAWLGTNKCADSQVSGAASPASSPSSMGSSILGGSGSKGTPGGSMLGVGAAAGAQMQAQPGMPGNGMGGVPGQQGAPHPLGPSAPHALGLGRVGSNRTAQQARQGWARLTPGPVKLGAFAAPAGALPPTPGMTANQPPPPGPSGAAMPPPPGGAPGAAPPPMPGAPQQAQQPGMLPPPTAPMTDAPPAMLPSNPRPLPTYPKSSDQAMGEATMLSSMEAKQQAEFPGQAGAMDDLSAQNMAMGSNPIKLGQFAKGAEATSGQQAWGLGLGGLLAALGAWKGRGLGRGLGERFGRYLNSTPAVAQGAGRPAMRAVEEAMRSPSVAVPGRFNYFQATDPVRRNLNWGHMQHMQNLSGNIDNMTSAGGLLGGAFGGAGGLGLGAAAGIGADAISKRAEDDYHMRGWQCSQATKPLRWLSELTRQSFFDKAANEDETGSEPSHPHDYRMRGWQWRTLQRDATTGMKSWLPRVFTSEATPLTELLASPGKQGILHGLVGAGVGAGAGYLGGQAAGMDPALGALAGGGAGALAGGVYGYGQRRQKNDHILDALRRTPPGAVVRDWDQLKAQDAGEKSGMAKQAVDIVLKDGTNLGDHEKLGRELATKMRDAASDTESSRLLHDALIKHLTPFGEKAGAQHHDGSYMPQRSAVGESKGLSFTASNYDRGQDAWSSLSGCFKGGSKVKEAPNPFNGQHRGKEAGVLDIVGKLFRGAGKAAPTTIRTSGALTQTAPYLSKGVANSAPTIESRWPQLWEKLKGLPQMMLGAGAVGMGAAQEPKMATDSLSASFFVSLLESGWPEERLKEAVDRISLDFPEAEGELRAGLEKLAGLWGSMVEAGKNLAAPIGRFMARPGVAAFTQHAVPTAGGAALGAFGGHDLPGGGTGSMLGDAALGATAFNPALSRYASGRGAGAMLNPALRAVQGGLIGGGTGSVLDPIASAAGLEGTNFGRLGGTLGTGFGLASGAGRAMRQMSTPGSGMQQYGRNLMSFGEGALNTVRQPIANLGRGLGMSPATMASANPRFAAHGRNAAMGLGAVLGGRQAVEGGLNRMRSEGDQYLGSRLPVIANYAQQRAQQALGGMTQHMNPLAGMGQHVDRLIAGLGMDPRAMSTLQKAMLLGGGGLALGGAVAGSPIAAGVGGAAMIPGLMRGFPSQSPLAAGTQGQPAPGAAQGQQPPTGQPGTPTPLATRYNPLVGSDRNEFLHQQR